MARPQASTGKRLRSTGERRKNFVENSRQRGCTMRQHKRGLARIFLGVRDFFDAARRYRQVVIDYFIDSKAFGARQWFAADKGTVDWNTLPQFSFQRADIGANAKRALPDVCLLLIINLALFMLISLIFQKSEV